MSYVSIAEPRLSRFIFSNTIMAWFWLVVRIYLGWQWLEAGWEKVTSPLWTGPDAGAALIGFVQGAVAKTAGAHPDVQGWYASFLSHMVLPHVHGWSFFVAYGELLVGLGLLVGALTGIAAFFGLFMNLNYLLAGTVSTNPTMFVLAIGIVLAWRIAGYIGIDHWLLPRLNTRIRLGVLRRQST